MTTIKQTIDYCTECPKLVSNKFIKANRYSSKQDLVNYIKPVWCPLIQRPKKKNSKYKVNIE